MSPAPSPSPAPHDSSPLEVSLLLLAPLRREAAALERSLEAPRCHTPPAGLQELVTGRLAGRRVALAVTGDGPVRAQAGIAAALRAVRPRRLLAFGVAGALSPGLTVGELVWARRVIGPGGRILEPTLPPQPDLPPGTPGRVNGPRLGAVITRGRLVTTPVARAELLHRIPGRATGRDEAVVVDLESSHFATAAEAAGIPWIVLRAVSDTADDTLPAYLERCRDAGGSVRNGRVVIHALARPWTFPSLLLLGRRVQTCSRRLAMAVTTWVESREDDLETPEDRP